jgi:hypothetical protein
MYANLDVQGLLPRSNRFSANVESVTIKHVFVSRTTFSGLRIIVSLKMIDFEQKSPVASQQNNNARPTTDVDLSDVSFLKHFHKV